MRKIIIGFTLVALLFSGCMIPNLPYGGTISEAPTPTVCPVDSKGTECCKILDPPECGLIKRFLMRKGNISLCMDEWITCP